MMRLTLTSKYNRNRFGITAGRSLICGLWIFLQEKVYLIKDCALWKIWL